MSELTDMERLRLHVAMGGRISMEGQQARTLLEHINRAQAAYERAIQGEARAEAYWKAAERCLKGAGLLAILSWGLWL